MLTLPSTMQREIDRRFSRVMDLLPEKKRELEAYASGCDQAHRLCLQFLWGFLPLSDVLTFSPEQLDGYVSAALKARRELPYGASVPTELFLNYVLMPRVNNEHLDLGRSILQEALWQRVQAKTMTQAALEVNYWCLEHVTYHPSDDRTLGPLAVMRSTLGRCGEESTFAVSALRSVGIPARQCYVPRWSHCDDNHAWVELWAEDGWHYLGACEPEPVLDRGWFTAAASRAMVVHSRTLSTLVTEPGALRRTDHDTLIHSTGAYARCEALEVQVLDHGKPAPGVHLQFQLVNDSQCHAVYEADTDSEGSIRFSTGKGGLRLQLCHKGRLLTRVVDTRQERKVTLDLRHAKAPGQLHAAEEAFDLAAPAEGAVPSLPPVTSPAHFLRLAQCDAARAAYARTFRRDLPPEARGNWPELERFLLDARFPAEEKQQLLSTLRPKDYLDCTAEMLSDTLACARVYRDRFDPELYQTCILAPRVANEMLLPVRSRLLAQIPERFTDGRSLLTWLKASVRVIEDDAPLLVPDCAMAMAHRCINKSAFGVLFVTLCRTFGIPARQNPSTLAWEWLEDGSFRSMDAAAAEPELALHLVNGSGQPLPYGQRFTLGRFQKDRYETLRYDGLTLDRTQTLAVPPGEYVLTATTRQIDGTVSVRIRHESLREAATLTVLPPEDQTASRIRRIPLELPAGPVRSCLEATEGRRMLLFLEPGKEPTQHLLQELLECREACTGYGLLLFAASQADTKNETLQKVLAALPHAVLQQSDDAAGLQSLRQAMGIGDPRLPFALALDGQGCGLYACANYNIHTAQTLLRVQSLSQAEDCPAWHRKDGNFPGTSQLY